LFHFRYSSHFEPIRHSLAIFAIDITLDIVHIGSCLSLLDDFQRIILEPTARVSKKNLE
jgi:hypothetical protein